MNSIILYHGSDKIISSPKYKFGNPNNDYGYGFYCTKDFELAKEWANREVEHGYVNEYQINISDLKVLDLTDKNKYTVLNWLAILMHFRQLGDRFRIVYKEALEFLDKFYVEPTDYDVVIGYRADDAYFSFPLAFLDNKLTLEKLEEIYLSGNLGVQYVAISERAIKRFSFLKVYDVEAIYKHKYHKRKDDAVNKFQTILTENKYEKGDRIIDLINKE